MKKVSLNSVTLALVILIAGTIWMSAPAHAFTWVSMQGGSGKVEIPQNTTGVLYKGWGLDFSQKPNLTNWVHYQIPTNRSSSISPKVRYVYLEYYKSTHIGKIAAFHIYDGRVKIQEITVSANTAGSWATMVIDLGEPRSISKGLGVSIYVTSGADGYTTFKIGNVKARFE